MIINGELETGLGGGVCQVSTTVFNAAYEAGLPITSRTNHALYISHYPLGRDATVDYPNIDLKFVNDTGNWLLLRTFVGSSSLVVNLYGTPQHRRVETETAPLRIVAPAPVEKRFDKSLAPGHEVVDGVRRPRAERRRVHRMVYAASGKLLSDSTWVSNYESSRRSSSSARRSRKKKPPTTPGEDRQDDDRRERPDDGRRQRRRRPRRLRSSDRLDEPGGQPRRPERRRVDGAVRRPAVGDRRAVARDRVLEAEPRAAHVEAARVDDQPVVEPRRRR